ncbi:MAG: NAD(P)-binding protein [Deltaproteobacteria bacterium]|nr:NAD(P)-binding protein [Deltaproteobacteria bacterium]
MGTEKVDVIVIGSGVAGMTAAGMLAQDCKKKVVVLERAQYIGGRCLSYVGEGKTVVADGVEMDAKAFEKSLGLAHCYLGKCTPDIETIFEEGLLDGRTFEAGGHGLFWGNNNRADFMLKHFGQHVEMPLNRGLGFIEWQGLNEDGSVKPTISHQVEKGKPYSWMSEEGFAKTMHQLGDMSRLTFKDLTKLTTVPLQSWLEERGMHPEAYNYIKVLAACQTGQAEPRMTAAADFLGYMAMARDIRMNLTTGSVATVDKPGTIAIPLALEKPITDNGGEIWRNTPVTEVIIENGVAKGVKYKKDGVEQTLLADNVICTIPPKYLFQVLPENAFPAEWVNFMRDEHWGIGLLTGWVGTKRSIVEDIGIDKTSFIWMPGITTPEEGFIGVVDMVMCEFDSWKDGEADRAPEGKTEYLFSTALTDKEMRDPERVNLVIERCEAWARATFPNWDEDVEFILWTPSPEALGTYRPIGTERPTHKNPYVEGLWLAGDQYGEKCWGCGVDFAVLSGIVCVDKMMGTNFEEELFPPHHRGLPIESAE